MSVLWYNTLHVVGDIIEMSGWIEIQTMKERERTWRFGGAATIFVQTRRFCHRAWLGALLPAH